MKAAPVALLCAFIGATALAGQQRAVRPGVLIPPSAVDNNSSCDIGTFPAATLLLPYFEVEAQRHVAEADNTIFSVLNTSRQPQIARVTIWTDYGYPALWFNLFLTGYDVASVSLYDVIVNGVLPQTSSAFPQGTRSRPNNANPNITSVSECESLGGPLPRSVVDNVVALLTKGTAEEGCRVGGQHTMATGYVTIDVVANCSKISPLDPNYYAQVLLFDNVLSGDYEHILPDKSNGNYAGGNPMVHIRAVPEGGPAGSIATGLPYTFYDRLTPRAVRGIDRRQPLPSSFAARFIEGGTGAFHTDYKIWREGQTSAIGCTSANAAIPYASIVRYDEFENPTVGSGPRTFPVTMSLATNSSAFPPRVGSSVSGWMLLDLDSRAGLSSASAFSLPRPSQNWVIIHMRAEGRYGVDYDATSLGNGCTNQLQPGGITK